MATNPFPRGGGQVPGSLADRRFPDKHPARGSRSAPVRGERGRKTATPAQRGAALRSYINGLLKSGKKEQIRKGQQFLRAQGYLVVADGSMGPVTASARDAFVRGQSPASWARFVERRFGITPGKVKPSPGAANHPDSRGPGGGAARNRNFGGGARPVKAAAADTAPSSASAAFGLRGSPAIGMPIPEDWASDMGAKLFDPDMADTIAGLEYDSMIASLQQALGQTERQNQQNLHDIKTWFDQVLGHQRTAAQRDAEINAAGQGSMEQATKSILSSIGGEANEGAGVVGAAGAEALGTLKAIGTAQEQYNADLAPLLELEKSGNLAKEAAAGTTRLQTLRGDLASAQRERGQRKSTAMLDLQQLNNEIKERQLERLIQIRGANNQLGQQGFQNNVALAELDLAAAGLDLDVAKLAQDAAEFNASQAAKLPGWQNLRPEDSRKLASDIMVSVKAPNGAWRLPLNATWARILGIVRSRGLNPFEPQGRQFLAGVAQSLGIRLGPKGNPIGRR